MPGESAPAAAGGSPAVRAWALRQRGRRFAQKIARTFPVMVARGPRRGMRALQRGIFPGMKPRTAWATEPAPVGSFRDSVRQNLARREMCAAPPPAAWRGQGACAPDSASVPGAGCKKSAASRRRIASAREGYGALQARDFSSFSKMALASASNASSLRGEGSAV